MTLSKGDREDFLEELLDERYPELEIGDLTFTAGGVLRKCDPASFRGLVLDSFVEVDLDDYPEHGE